MREGGEEMRAQLAMEEAQRSRGAGAERGSGLTPEEERRRGMERGVAHRGMGETQQAQMAMWGREGEPRRYAEGERERYEELPLERASSGESFTSGPRIGQGREEERERMRYEQAPTLAGEQRMHERGERLERASSGESFTSGPSVSRMPEQRVVERVRYEQPPTLAGAQRMHERGERLERASSGESFTSGPSVSRMTERREAERERYEQAPRLERASSGEYFTSGPAIPEREAGEKRVVYERTYPAGTGSSYKLHGPPLERASTGESFTSGPREIGAERRERMEPSERTYRAGTGSMYRLDQPPLERASTGESFTSGPEPTGHPPAQPPAEYGREEAPSRQAPTERVKGMAAGVTTTAKGATRAVSERLGTSEGREQVTSTAVSRGKDVSHMVTEKAREFGESNRAEDVAARAGETIGKVLRKTISVAKGMSSGLKRGMGESEERREGMEYRETSEVERGRIEEREVPRREHETVQKESTTREYPEGEERRYKEVRRKENE